MPTDETPKTIIVRQLRQLWLRSRERAAALKRDKYCCQRCGVKASTAKGKEQKVVVHHKEGIGNWDRVIEVLREEILCDPIKLETLCPDCHEEE
jgi:hypothetical protein